MLYLVGALGIGGVILFLLWRSAANKAEAERERRAKVEVHRDALEEVNKINEALKDEVVKDKREAMAQRLKELEATVKKAKPGEVIEDFTGVGRGGAEPKVGE